MGDTIEYRITATNTGNLDLTGLSITDKLTTALKADGVELALTGDSDATDFDLTVGANAVFTASYEIEAGDKTVSNTLIIGKDNPPTPPPETHDDIKDWTVEKTITNLPVNGYYLLGETVEFRIDVVNTGALELNLMLTDVLSDNGEVEILNGPALDDEGYFILPVNGETTFTCAYTPEAAVLDLVNTATVHDKDKATDLRESATEPVDVIDFTLEKAVVAYIPAEGGDEIPADNTQLFLFGEQIIYEITVTFNDMTDIDQDTVSVLDAMAGGEPLTLNRTEGNSLIYRYAHTVTEDDFLTETLVNEATATHTPDAEDPERVLERTASEEVMLERITQYTVNYYYVVGGVATLIANPIETNVGALPNPNVKDAEVYALITETAPLLDGYRLLANDPAEKTIDSISADPTKNVIDFYYSQLSGLRVRHFYRNSVNDPYVQGDRVSDRIAVVGEWVEQVVFYTMDGLYKRDAVANLPTQIVPGGLDANVVDVYYTRKAPDEFIEELETPLGGLAGLNVGESFE